VRTETCGTELLSHLKWGAATGRGVALFGHIVLEKVLRVVHPGRANEGDLTLVVLDEAGITVARGRTWLGILNRWVCPHLHAFTLSTVELRAVLWSAALLLLGAKSVMRNVELFAVSPDSTVVLVVRAFQGAAVTKLVGFFRRTLTRGRTAARE
jgi:hypothetical protein